MFNIVATWNSWGIATFVIGAAIVLAGVILGFLYLALKLLGDTWGAVATFIFIFVVIFVLIGLTGN